MRILVTNDDGIESDGIHELARALAGTDHEVVVVAPDRDWSGASAALGVLHPDSELAVERVRIPDAPDVEAWSLAGPPALCVVAGRLGAFGELPDLVVSGINAGLNTGRSILHSGTVGAALAAQNFGISGLAVSVASPDPSDPTDGWHWDTAATLAVETLDLLIAAPDRSVLNLNVPALARDRVAGVRWTQLAPFGAVRAAMSARGERALQFELHPTEQRPGPDTDQGAVDQGWAALTTLVGVVEAWPAQAGLDADSERGSAEVGFDLVPGAELHPVHVVPDASEHSLLRRPALGT
jgi:5'-nucleotidase